MAWSGGTFTRAQGSTEWQDDAALQIGIEAATHDNQDNDLATGINTCLTKDGQNTPTANLPMGGYKHTGVGDATATGQYTTYNQLRDATFSANLGVSSIQTTGATTPILNIDSYSNDTTRSTIQFRKSRGTTLNSNVIVNNGDTYGSIVWQGANGTSYSDGARIRAVVTDTPGATNDMPGTIIFDTTPNASATLTERMRITNAGDVCIGRTSTLLGASGLSVGKANGNVISELVSLSLADGEGAYLYIRGTATGNRAGQLGVYKHSGISNPAAYLYLQEEDAGDNYLWVSNAGNLMISATVANIGTATGTVVGTQTSDERVKNIKPGPFNYGLSDILALTPVEYELKDELGVNKLGFTAQQTQPIIPEAVYNTGDAIPGEDPTLPKLGMDYSQIIPVLVKAVQELAARVESLENAS